MTEERNILLKDPDYDQLSDSDLKRKTAEGTVPVRARALGALARRAARQNELLDYVSDAILDPRNRKLEVMGVVSVSYLGIYGLLITQNDECVKKARELYEKWPPEDRENLRDWLSSEGFPL